MVGRIARLRRDSRYALDPPYEVVARSILVEAAEFAVCVGAGGRAILVVRFVEQACRGDVARIVGCAWRGAGFARGLLLFPTRLDRIGRFRRVERELESLRSKAAGSATADLAGSARDVDGIKVVAARLEGLDAKSLRDSLDKLKQQLGDCVVLLAGAADGRVSLVAGVHGAALGRIKAGDVVAHVARQIDGKGGGRPDMAQGGGADASQLPELLAGLRNWVADRLSNAKPDA